jgi:hypothetical protein
MADIEVEVPSPLRECFQHCEVHCVRACCGLDAISTDAELIAVWGREAGPQAVAWALRQLSELVETVADRRHKVSSQFLNHYTCHEAARQQLLDFLGAFRSALESAG